MPRVFLFFCNLLEVFWTNIAEWTFFWSCFTFVYITAYETYVFLIHGFKYLNC